MNKTKPCQNPDCSCSTGIHEGLTFGSGELDEHGYWEKPCRICAVEHDKAFTSEQRLENLRKTFEAEGRIEAWIKGYMETGTEWITEPAWPYHLDLTKPEEIVLFIRERHMSDNCPIWTALTELINDTKIKVTVSSLSVEIDGVNYFIAAWDTDTPIHLKRRQQ